MPEFFVTAKSMIILEYNIILYIYIFIRGKEHAWGAEGQLPLKIFIIMITIHSYNFSPYPVTFAPSNFGSRLRPGILFAFAQMSFIIHIRQLVYIRSYIRSLQQNLQNLPLKMPAMHNVVSIAYIWLWHVNGFSLA